MINGTIIRNGGGLLGWGFRLRNERGLWTLDGGLWTLDIGRWILDGGNWTLDGNAKY